MDSKATLLQLLQRPRSPFFGTITISAVFQISGITSVYHISLKILVKASSVSSPPAFNISALIQSTFLVKCVLFS